MDYQAVSRRSSILLGERQTTVFQRFSAKAIDVIVVVAIFFLAKTFWPPLGGVLAGFFAAFADAMGNGQSVGKKIMGLRVIDDPTGMNCSLWSSLLRNVPFAACVLFAGIPVFWALALFVSAPICLLEAYLIIMLDCGVRLGDIMANTYVAEYFEGGIGATR